MKARPMRESYVWMKIGVDPPPMLIDDEMKTGDKSTKGDEPKYPPPYPQRVNKKKEDKHFQIL